MSTPLAIAAVTATLRYLLDEGLNRHVPGTTVTTRPPDKARDPSRGNQVNLFLYQTVPNAAWRNLDPGRVRPGDGGPSPLALTLYYLLSVYGQNDDEAEPLSHRLLGLAMGLLHEHPVLDPLQLRGALEAVGLNPPLERVRITLQPLSLEDMAKLWTMFQTPYRLSVAYEVSVVLLAGPGSPSQTSLRDVPP